MKEYRVSMKEEKEKNRYIHQAPEVVKVNKALRDKGMFQALEMFLSLE